MALLRSRWLLPVLAGVVVLVGASVWALLASPWLRAAQITVSGATPEQDPGITQAAGGELGKPLLQIDTDRIVTEVNRVGAFSGVSVSRRWPDTIGIEVQPRVPILAVRDVEGKIQLVDNAGIAFSTVEKPPPGVPEMIAPKPLDPTSLNQAVAILNAISAAQRAELRSVEMTSGQRVVLRTARTAIVWGPAERNEDKARVLDVIRQQGAFRMINLSAPDAPVTVA